MKSKTQSKRGRARFFFFFLLSLLILNFGVKGYWKLKSYSFQSYFKDVWEKKDYKRMEEWLDTSLAVVKAIEAK